MAILTYNGMPIDCGGYIPPFTAQSKNWSWLRYGSNVWHTNTGRCIYSSGTTHRQLSGGTWSDISASGLSSFNGSSIWTTANHSYYSNGNTQYTVQYSFGSLSLYQKTWTGLTRFYGAYVWSDGTDIYVSDDWNASYVLNESTSTWTSKTWGGFNDISGGNVWTDGTNIYYSNGSNQYVLDKSNDTWYQKTWNGLSSFNGYNVWSLGGTIYYSDGSSHYLLDSDTSTWKRVYSDISFPGQYVWSDDGTTYVSNNYVSNLLIANTVSSENNFIFYETT